MELLVMLLMIVILIAGMIIAFKVLITGELLGCAFVCFITVGICIPFIKLYNYLYEKSGNAERARKEDELQRKAEKYAATHPEEFAPWERKYMPNACPYCGRYTVRYSNWDDKKMSVAFWGVYGSQKISQHYKCDSCKKMW